jgi:hypothetical protein
MSDPISKSTAAMPTAARLPEELRPLFWDHPFDEIDFMEHRDFVGKRGQDYYLKIVLPPLLV